MITLEQIIYHLKENGVKNIILFDYSCSNYLDSEFNDITSSSITGPRVQRPWRETMIGSRLFGGRKRKTKSKKSNKKRRSNRKRLTKRAM